MSSLERQALVQVVHGRVAERAELAVDLADQLLDPAPLVDVVVDALPGRHGDLHHDVCGGDRGRRSAAAPGRPRGARRCPWCSRAGRRRAARAWARRAGGGSWPASGAVSGRRAISSNSATSIEIGKAPTRMVRPSNWTSGTSPSTSTSRRARETKFSAATRRWKPTRSQASRPRRTSSRHGSRMNSSWGGNGMWRKNPIRTSGRSSRRNSGTSCRW